MRKRARRARFYARQRIERRSRARTWAFVMHTDDSINTLRQLMGEAVDMLHGVLRIGQVGRFG